MGWDDLYERAAEYDISLEAIEQELSAHRKETTEEERQ